MGVGISMSEKVFNKPGMAVIFSQVRPVHLSQGTMMSGWSKPMLGEMNTGIGPLEEAGGTKGKV
jgi:hypothetical protein